MKHFLYVFFFVGSVCNAQELVKDINTWPAGQNSYDSRFCFSCGNKTYLIATDGAHGSELWVTDGTESGTKLVKDLKEGPQSGLIDFPKCAGGKLYFGGEGLWRTDGTESGTQQVFSYRITRYAIVGSKIFFFGADGSLYSINDDLTDLKIIQTYDSNTISVSTMVATSDKVFLVLFRYSEETYFLVDSELLVTDGTSVETVYVSGEYEEIQSPTVIGDKVVFGTNYNSGSIWVTDGTEEGTKELLEDVTITNTGLVSINGNEHALLQGLDENNGTWFTDGTSEGTFKALDNEVSQNAIQFNDEFYFLTIASPGTYEIVKTDANFQNMVGVSPYDESNGNRLLGIVNDKLLYAASGDQGVELFATDGETSTIIKDINPGNASSGPRAFFSTGAMGIFLADDGTHGYEFWKTDGTASGTSLLKDIFEGTLGALIQTMYKYNGKVYFQANSSLPTNPHWALWQSDGTTEGTTVLSEAGDYYNSLFIGTGKYVVTWGIRKTDLENGNISFIASPGISGYGGGANIRGAQVGDNFYFFYDISYSGNDPGTELWRVNTATNELAITKDINPGPFGSFDNYPSAGLGNKLIFSAVSPDGIEPWVTDGTEEGTIQLKDIVTDGDSYPRGFVTMGNKVYFIARAFSGDDYRRTIWVTDGTAEGTHIVKELGEKGGVTSNDLGVIGNSIIFGWTPGDATVELWKSDGTGAGTSSLVLMPQVEYDISSFITIGNKLVFTTDYNELWVTDGTAGGTSILDFPHETTVYPTSVRVVDNVAYFLNENKIWRTDGIGVSLIGPAQPVGDFEVNDNYVLFLQDDPQYGRELFRYDLSEITGLNEITKEVGSVVYPNPTTHTLFVKAGSPTALRIVDMNGRERHSQFITSDVSIDVSSYADGMYVVILNNKPFKFIKRH